MARQSSVHEAAQVVPLTSFDTPLLSRDDRGPRQQVVRDLHWIGSSHRRIFRRGSPVSLQNSDCQRLWGNDKVLNSLCARRLIPEVRTCMQAMRVDPSYLHEMQGTEGNERQMAELLKRIRARDEEGVLDQLALICTSSQGDEIDSSTGPNAGEIPETTPLMEAVQVGSVRIVDALLDAGADINAGSVHAVSPLCVAAAVNNVTIARLLIQRGANTRHLVDRRALCQVITPLQFAIEANNVTMAGVLLDNGHDPNYPSKMYRYPLTETIRLNRVGIARLLVQHPDCVLDGHIDGYGTWEFPPLHQALFRYHRWDIARVLLETCRCRLSFQGDSYLCMVLWRANEIAIRPKSIALMLMSAGADLSAKDRQGQLPFRSFLSAHQRVRVQFCVPLLRLVALAGFTPSLDDVMALQCRIEPSREGKELCDWLTFLASRPRSLKDQIRRMLRKLFGVYPSSRLQQLPLPTALVDFLTFTNLKNIH